MLRKNSAAHTRAMKVRIVLAGSTASTSRYFRPVKPSTKSSSLSASAYRSNQYATALSKQMRPRINEIWTWAASVACNPFCSRIPP